MLRWGQEQERCASEGERACAPEPRWTLALDRSVGCSSTLTGGESEHVWTDAGGLVWTRSDEAVSLDSQTPMDSFIRKSCYNLNSTCSKECFSFLSCPGLPTPLALPFLRTHLYSPCHRDSNPWSPNRSNYPRLLSSPLRQPAAASYKCVPFVRLCSSSLWHQCPLILTISYVNYCKNLPTISLAFCSSCLSSVTPPASPFQSASVTGPLSGSETSLTRLDSLHFSQCLQLKTQSLVAFSISEFILSHALSRAYFFLLFL